MTIIHEEFVHYRDPTKPHVSDLFMPLSGEVLEFNTSIKLNYDDIKLNHLAEAST